MISTKDATINYSEGCINKATMPLTKMFVLAFLSGMFISLAGVASTIGSVSVSLASVSKIVTALIFPLGLAMVIITGAELFTGNNLMVIGLLDKRISFLSMLKNWVVVYIGNFVGSLFVTGLFTVGHIYSAFDGAVATTVINTAVTKCSISFSDAFIKAIFCNILVCIAVMMAATADAPAGKIAALFVPIFVFVLCGFEHSVANMSYISGGLFVNASYGNMGIDVTNLTWYNFLVTNLVPVTLGNIVGGTGMGVIYWIIKK